MQMKRVQPSGFQNRKKKKARIESENQQRGALDAWVKTSCNTVHDSLANCPLPEGIEDSQIGNAAAESESADHQMHTSEDCSEGAPIIDNEGSEVGEQEDFSTNRSIESAESNEMNSNEADREQPPSKDNERDALHLA